MAHNSEPIRTETRDELVSLIAMATGIPAENIVLITYDHYNYTPMEVVAKDWTFYFQLLLAVILIAFLFFVVFRGMAPVEVTELEPELSVEQLLATTKENQSLEDILGKCNTGVCETYHLRTVHVLVRTCVPPEDGSRAG